MVTRRRFIDWRFVTAVSVLALVSFVVWNGVDANRRADEALTTMQQHDQAAQVDRAAAAQDRTTAAANQKALLDYTAALAARQDALLTYLRAHGIHLPQRLVTVIEPPRIVVRHPRAGHHVKRRRASSTASPGTSTPPQPGNSGGHRKHPHRPHRH